MITLLKYGPTRNHGPSGKGDAKTSVAKLLSYTHVNVIRNHSWMGIILTRLQPREALLPRP